MARRPPVRLLVAWSSVGLFSADRHGPLFLVLPALHPHERPSTRPLRFGVLLEPLRRPMNMTAPQLQATLAAASAGGDPVLPHHPINCQAELGYDPADGVLDCPHAKTEPKDVRTAGAVRHSIAILLIEMASQL